jgi:ribosome-associated toxin RatA of RatAB toxin-antitoxin module
MPHVEVAALTRAGGPVEIYRRLREFERYPEQTEAVVKVIVFDRAPDRCRSSWEVRFRNGILRWEEEDLFDDERRIISFRQTRGDLEHFAGRWLVEERGEACAVIFSADFEIGIPLLASVINPLAKQALKDNVVLILTGLLGENITVMKDSG